MKLIAGNSNPSLSSAIAHYLGVPLAPVIIQPFPNGEICVEIQENIRGEDVYVIQSTSFPTNDHLMELLLIIDALKRSSARRITAVMPYFAYARQDRKTGPRTPLSAKLVANLLMTAGIDRLLTFELHSQQIQGFFDIPVENLFASPSFARDITDRQTILNPVIISPDIGGVARARGVAERLQKDLAIVDKRRLGPRETEVLNIIGSVAQRHCILIDDLCDSGATLIQATQVLKDAGALSIRAYVAHGVFSGIALNDLQESPLDEVIVTDTIAPENRLADSSKVRVLSLAPLLGEALSRMSQEKSVSSLFL
jgi:ribose-phosphate pyrophosphokinase